MTNNKQNLSRRRARKSQLPGIEIRLMEITDLPAVFRLGSRLFTAEEWPTLYRAWDDHDLTLLFANSAETCLVAESAETGRIVGFALGSMMEKPRSAWRYGWLEWLAVSRRYQRQGVAARLMRQLTRLFIERNARIMLVDTDEDNAKALAFFRKIGFGQELRHVYLSRNLDDHPEAIERKNSLREEDE